MKHSEMEAWLKDYIERWEAMEQEACGWGGREPFKDMSETESELIEELAEFCEEHNLPNMSADDLESCFDGEYLSIPVAEEYASLIQKRTGTDWSEREDDGEFWVFDNDGRWVIQLKDGTFWTIAIREDRIFPDRDSAFKWLNENL